MTIEIHQLIIRAVVQPAAAISDATTLAAAASLPREVRDVAHRLSPAREAALVGMCVRTVLRKLERSRER